MAKRSYFEGFGKCLWEYDIDEENFLFENPHLQSKVITERFRKFKGFAR